MPLYLPCSVQWIYVNKSSCSATVEQILFKNTKRVANDFNPGMQMHHADARYRCKMQMHDFRLEIRFLSTTANSFSTGN